MLNVILFFSCSTEQKVGVYDTPPSVSIVGPASGSIFDEAEVVGFEFIVKDDVDSPQDLILLWTSDFQGELDAFVTPDSSGAGIYNMEDLDAGNHVVTLTAVDSYGQSSSDYVSVKINELSEAPEISIVHPTGGEVGQENHLFLFVVAVMDARDNPEDITVSFSSDLDGEFCSPPPDLEGIVECEYGLSAGEHNLSFTAENTFGYTVSAPSYFIVKPTEDIDDDGDGFTENQGDCNDSDPSINPIGDEVENGIDDDCNGEIDEGDDDGDGYNEEQGDCDDTNPNIHPNAEEIPNNEDDDCDGTIDEGTGR